MDRFTEVKLMNRAIRSFTNNEAYYRWQAYIPENADENDFKELANDENKFNTLRLHFNNLFIKFFQFGFNSGSKEVRDFVNAKQKELFVENVKVGDAQKFNFEDREYIEETLDDYNIPLSPEEFCEKLLQYYNPKVDDYELAVRSVLSKYIDDATSIDEYNRYADEKKKENVYTMRQFNDFFSVTDPLEIASLTFKGNFNPKEYQYFTLNDAGDALIGYYSKAELLEDDQDFQDWRIESNYQDLYKDKDFKSQITAALKSAAAE